MCKFCNGKAEPIIKSVKMNRDKIETIGVQIVNGNTLKTYGHLLIDEQIIPVAESVSNYINQNSYKLTNIKTSTNNYAYFPIYFNFKSLESLTNSLSGTYTDTITVTITQV